MGRYWFILRAANTPASQPRSTATINLQTAGAVQGDLREGMEAYFKWMESLAPDCRVNARNIFGFRGASYPLLPDKSIGVVFLLLLPLCNRNLAPLDFCGDRDVRQFWDHYLVTGDRNSSASASFRPLKNCTLLRRLPYGHRQERELPLRPVFLAGEYSLEYGSRGTDADQRDHGYRGLPGSPDEPARSLVNAWY